MARIVCVKPCAPTNLPKIQIPFMGAALMAQGNLSVKGGCDGCELIGNFLLQINPLLSSLGLPLCLLGCVSALIEVAKAIPDTIGPPPDLTAITDALEALITKCECVLAMVLPPPAGPICDFLKMVRDIINVLAMIVNCLTGLLTHLASFSLRASVMLMSPIAEIRATGKCLVVQGQSMNDSLMSKLGPLGSLFALLEPIFSLLSAVVPDPFSATITDLKNGFSIFAGVTVPGVQIGSALAAVQEFDNIIGTTAAVFTDIVSICP